LSTSRVLTSYQQNEPGGGTVGTHDLVDCVAVCDMVMSPRDVI